MIYLWFILSALALFGVVIYCWLRERRFLKKKTSETMGPRVWRDIVQEREAALQKRRLFHDAMEKAKHHLP